MIRTWDVATKTYSNNIFQSWYDEREKVDGEEDDDEEEEDE